jgi:outer membrane lipoprotein-sorting protein
MSEAGQTLHRAVLLACMVVLAGATHALAGSAEDDKAKAGNAVGGAGNWQTTVTNKGGSLAALDDKQAAALKDINAYFNAIGDLRGKFLQTDAQQQQQKGEFYIKRPGKFRFVYGAPSQLVILSDGETLSFEDYDLKKADRYPVETSPFRILLGKDVNINRDANIKELSVTDDLVSITLQDKSPDSEGQIQLFFVKSGGKMELKEWQIAGPQGDNTRVEVANIDRDKPVDPSYFENAPLELQTKPNK